MEPELEVEENFKLRSLPVKFDSKDDRPNLTPIPKNHAWELGPKLLNYKLARQTSCNI